jgi:hypothetical protein
VPDREFLFAVHLSSPHRFDEMLMELASKVLDDAGYTNREAAELVASMQAELARSETDHPDGRGVQFRAREGELQIVISESGGRQWRMARPLP